MQGQLEMTLVELADQHVLPEDMWNHLYNVIAELSEEELEELGHELGKPVGMAIKNEDLDSWFTNEQAKNKYITSLIDELFYIVFDKEYEEYREEFGDTLIAEQGELSQGIVSNEFSEWAQLSIEQLLQKPAQQLYDLSLVLADPMSVNTILNNNIMMYVDTYEEAIERMENGEFPEVKVRLAEHLFELLSFARTEEVHTLVNQQPLDIATWQRWYENYGVSFFNQSKTSPDLQAPNKIVWYEGLDLEKYDCYRVQSKINLHTTDLIICNGTNGGVFVGIAQLETIRIDKDSPTIQVVTWRNSSIVVDIQTLSNESYYLLAVEEKDGEVLREAIQFQSLPTCTVYRLPFNMDYLPLQTIDTKLCIDFGTTNTTAGCYLKEDYVNPMPENAIKIGNIVYENQEDEECSDGVNFISFYDTSQRNRLSLTEMKNVTVPTVVYIDSIDTETNNVSYKFGYDALATVRQRKAESDSVTSERKVGMLIYGLKRWMNDLEESERLVDSNGNIAFVKRFDIVKSYIHYVINRANHQVKGNFNQLHFSAPIKMKARFINEFVRMFPIEDGYEVTSDKDTLDEGIAVLYDVIHQDIERRKNEDAIDGKALIIDCGGGTTDLAQCQYTVNKSGWGNSRNLKITTNFENGNPNFGGNNLTYRILQMIKIKLSSFYRKSDGNNTLPVVSNYLDSSDKAKNIINESGIDTTAMNESAIVKLYSKIDKAYKEAEQIIPTQFKRYEHYSSQFVEKVRHNFYFLWDMAEDIKRQFFSQMNKIQFNFIDADNAIETQIGKFKLHILSNEELEEYTTKPSEFAITIREIEQLIVPEIYAVEHQFLDKIDLQEFLKITTIKLTGQSCRIPYFREEMKEFIPGKYIRSSSQEVDGDEKQGTVDNKALELKLACVRGVINYWRDKARGKIKATIEQAQPIIPYDVLVLDSQIFNVEGEPIKGELLLAKGKAVGGSFGVAAIANEARGATVTISNERKQIGKNREIKLEQKGDLLTTEELKHKLQEAGFAQNDGRLRLLEDPQAYGYYLLYVYTDAESWGFTVQIISRNMQQNKWQVYDHYEPFEDANAYENFFDGLH